MLLFASHVHEQMEIWGEQKTGRSGLAFGCYPNKCRPVQNTPIHHTPGGTLEQEARTLREHELLFQAKGPYSPTPSPASSFSKWPIRCPWSIQLSRLPVSYCHSETWRLHTVIMICDGCLLHKQAQSPFKDIKTRHHHCIL